MDLNREDFLNLRELIFRFLKEDFMLHKFQISYPLSLGTQVTPYLYHHSILIFQANAEVI